MSHSLHSLICTYQLDAKRGTMKLTGDLKNPKLIYLKGFLFLVTGLLSATALLLESPTL